MVRAKAHRRIDRVDVSHPFIERIDGLIDHRQQDAVDDEGREILGVGRSLADALDHFQRGLEGHVVGGDAANDLNQLHHRHRIHEMKPDEVLRPVGRGGKAGDRYRRCVGGNHRLVGKPRTKILENLALDCLVFGRRLDDEITILHVVEALGYVDAL